MSYSYEREWDRFMFLKLLLWDRDHLVRDAYKELVKQRLLNDLGSILPPGGLELWTLAMELVEIRKAFCAQIDRRG